MRMLILAILALALTLQAQPPGGGGGRGTGGGRGGGRGGGGRAQVQTMSLTLSAWPDGGSIPTAYTQSGNELSPAVQWSAPPPNTASFVLILTDADTISPNSLDGNLHWLLWNIPATATGIPGSLPEGFDLPDGTRQLSVSGPRYRAPVAPATGPPHHLIWQLYALDTTLDVKVPAQGPQDPNPNAQTVRAAVLQAMLGHVRGKATYIGKTAAR